VSWWSFLVGFIVTVTVSLITPRHSDLKLEGLVYKRFGKKDK